jgi:hypothetical protein
LLVCLLYEQLAPGAHVGSHVTGLQWGPNLRLLSVVAAGGCFVLTRMVLQQRLRAGFMVSQPTTLLTKTGLGLRSE